MTTRSGGTDDFEDGANMTMGNPEQAVREVTPEELAWIDEAVGYDHAASVGAAYERLLLLRQVIERGGVLRLPGAAKAEFGTMSAYDEWVRQRYAVFAHDRNHPVFWKD